MRVVLLVVLIIGASSAGNTVANASGDAGVYWTTYANSAEIGASLCIGAMTDLREADLQSYLHNYKIVMASQWRGIKSFIRGRNHGSPYLRGLIESEGYWESLEGCFGADPEKWVRFTNMMIFSEGVGAVASFVIPWGVYRYLMSVAIRIPRVAQFLQRVRKVRRILNHPLSVTFMSVGFMLKRFAPPILEKIVAQNMALDSERFLQELDENSHLLDDAQAEAIAKALRDRSILMGLAVEEEYLKPEDNRDPFLIDNLQSDIEMINQALTRLQEEL